MNVRGSMEVEHMQGASLVFAAAVGRNVRVTKLKIIPFLLRRHLRAHTYAWSQAYIFYPIVWRLGSKNA